MPVTGPLALVLFRVLALAVGILLATLVFGGGFGWLPPAAEAAGAVRLIVGSTRKRRGR